MKEHALLGYLPQFRRDPVHTLVRLAEQGGVVPFRLGPRRLFLVTSPSGVQHILKDRASNYIKGRTMDVARPLLGENIASAEGETWHRFRRLIHPAFHRKRLWNMVDLIAGTVTEFYPRWDELAQAGRPVNLNQEMMQLTLVIIARLLFGKDILGQEEGFSKAFTDAMYALNRIAWTPWPRVAAMYVQLQPRFRCAKALLDEFIYWTIEERRRSEEEHNDLLGLLMEAKDPQTGTGLTREELRNQLLTLMLAGHETTALALSWGWYLLGRHRRAAQTLHEEAISVLGDSAPQAEDIERLTYTRMVVQEILRLYPSVWVLAREVVADDWVEGVPIPQGARVILSPYVTHRNPRLWPHPEAFISERFQGGIPGHLPDFAYYPFGGGPRKCVGYELAPLEMTIVLSMMIQRYEVELLPGYPVHPRPILTLQPHPGVYVRLIRR